MITSNRIGSKNGFRENVSQMSFGRVSKFSSLIATLVYIMFNSLLFAYEFGRVDQLGMIAALASLRPRVQIPPRPLCMALITLTVEF